MKHFSRYVGLDVHKDTISVGVAEGKGGEPYHFGVIRNSPDSVCKLIKKLSHHGEVVSFYYEAGPCGYGIYRQIKDLGHDCFVVAPSMIPRRPGDRVKTDRRDAVSLARLGRSGDLTPVWVPDEDHEAVRDLSRAREDMKSAVRRARQRLSSFLLRHGKVYAGKTNWTQAYFRWLERIKFAHPVQQIVFQEYVDAVGEAQQREASLKKEMEKALEGWSLACVVKGLMALRGLNLISSMTTIAELGDITRFDTPCPLMSFVGLVPSEHSSGPKRRQGAITRAGNAHVRRMLVEAAWSYRFPARKTAFLQRRAKKTSQAVQAIAWRAQKRLCARYRHLTMKGKSKNLVCTAVARELLGFIWEITNEVQRNKQEKAPAA
jgi:transposase